MKGSVELDSYLNPGCLLYPTMTSNYSTGFVYTVLIEYFKTLSANLQVPKGPGPSILLKLVGRILYTVCPGSSYPILYIFFIYLLYKMG